MKYRILFFLMIFFVSCKTDSHKTNFKKVIKKKISDNNFIDEHTGDTIKPDTFNLKNNYKLIIFPTLDKGKKVVNFKLIKGSKSNTYLLTDTFKSTYIGVYENKDFQNYFALHANLGTSNFYFWLYNKETGNEVLRGIQGHFDLKNELILYTDEDDGYKIYIYNVNTKVKTLINIPSELMGKQECTKYNDSYKTIYIKRVTTKYYYLGFRCCEPLSVSFKVKKQLK